MVDTGDVSRCFAVPAPKGRFYEVPPFSAGLRVRIPATVDWMTVQQAHPFAPEFFSDVVERWEADTGAIRYRLETPTPLEGSFDSRAQVCSVGGLVSLSFNPSRWMQLHSLDGCTSVREALDVANGLMRWLGLPEFTPAHAGFVEGMVLERKRERAMYRELSVGKPGTTMTSTLDRAPDYGASGAELRRLDVSQLFAVGCAQDARSAIAALQQVSVRGKAPRIERDYQAVSWSAQHWYVKYYRKAPELLAHAPKGHRDDIGALASWADAIGLVRYEVELRSRGLRKLGLTEAHAWSEADMLAVLKRHSQHDRCVMGRAGLSDVAPRLEALGVSPGQARRLHDLAHAYFNGADVRAGLSARTFRRYKDLLRQVGVDISQPSNVVAMPIPEKVIELRPVFLPAEFRRKPIVYGDPPEGSPAWKARQGRL